MGQSLIITKLIKEFCKEGKMAGRQVTPKMPITEFPGGHMGINHIACNCKIASMLGTQEPSLKEMMEQRCIGDILKYFKIEGLIEEEGAQETLIVSCTES
ncbi:MAG: hypothetical protein QW404_03680 [Candidatus Nanoarchaeia archaeon]